MIHVHLTCKKGLTLWTLHRLEAYATLTLRSVKRCLESTRREDHEPKPTTPTGQCSISFQPVSDRFSELPIHQMNGIRRYLTFF